MSALEWIQQYANKKWPKYPLTDLGNWRDFVEILTDLNPIYSKNIGEHRWYDDMLHVVEIDGKFIGYHWYHITGDMGWDDMGLTLNLDSVKFYEPKEIVTIIYKEVK